MGTAIADGVQAVTAVDGVPLVYETVAAATPQALLLHLHGLGINRRYALPLAGQLAERGITTCALDLRGHGESGGDRGYVEDYLLFLSDVRHVIDDIHSRAPELPLFLSGLSMGALIALATAMAYPSLLRGVIAMAPPFVDSYIPLAQKAAMLSKVAAATLDPSLLRDPYPTALSLGIRLTTNPAGNELMADDPHRQDEVTLKLYYELLRMNLYMGRHPRLLTTSLLLLLAGDDRVGRNWASRAFFSALSIADKTMLEYEERGHDLVLEYTDAQIAEDIAEWIAGRT